ncbi:unnamed protein product [Protopolystoma xenopodis]|uniref:Uncharacterized protein n=1 Tax=Protopolystoma xenopodis TaxID=117903 RepID=A0A448XHK1_9PLAT|nr:unnamed protein product [Protopolystoma xenopodis]
MSQSHVTLLPVPPTPRRQLCLRLGLSSTSHVLLFCQPKRRNLNATSCTSSAHRPRQVSSRLSASPADRHSSVVLTTTCLFWGLVKASNPIPLAKPPNVYINDRDVEDSQTAALRGVIDSVRGSSRCESEYAGVKGPSSLSFSTSSSFPRKRDSNSQLALELCSLAALLHHSACSSQLYFNSAVGPSDVGPSGRHEARQGLEPAVNSRQTQRAGRPSCGHGGYGRLRRHRRAKSELPGPDLQDSH